MKLFDKNQCMDICLKNSNKYVRKAVQDLINDFKRVSEYCVCPKIVDKESDCCIVIEENLQNSCEPIRDESYRIKTDGRKIRISADGYLGTMWGIYTFCEKYLGVEPCYLFNDLKTEKKSSLEIKDIDIKDGPKSFGFRGVFINDEDLLTGWKDGGGIRYIDFPYYNITVEKSVIDKVVETVLRLKLNLVIPASFLNIDNPYEKLLADSVAERGIYLSQHHLEPLGVSSFTFDNYCKKYGKIGTFSYINSPELMEEAWEFYANKWAEYDNVVWQIGLRGKSDRPMWQESVPTDEELKYYGKFISNAYEKEKEIVMRATNRKAKYFTSTLWMEGSILMNKGLLHFPESTIIVFADTGPNQMYGEEYDAVPREKNGQYGIYYHLQYCRCGPHLAPQTGLDKLYYHVKLAYDKGDNSYFIMNSSNIREFVFELGAYSEMAWNINTFSKEGYLDRYCKKYGALKDEAKKIITEYFKALPELDCRYLADHLSKYFNYSKKKAPDGIKNFVLKDGTILEHGRYLAQNFHKPLGKDLCKEYYATIKPVIPEFEKICSELEKLTEKVKGPLKKHTQVKWLLYSKTLLYIYKWYVNLFEAKLYCDKYESKKMKDSLITACRCLEGYLGYRKCAEYDEFENWYRGDLKTDVNQKLCDTKRLLSQVSDFS